MELEERRTRIQQIRTLPSQLEAAVLNLSEVQLTTHYLAGEWTVAQNVHHLVDSHINSFIRLKLILTEDRPPLKPYDQDMWANLPDADKANIQDSLLILHGLHRRWASLFESLTENQWKRVGHHADLGDITPEDLLRIYSDHGEGHLDQIQRTLAAQS